MENTYLPTYSTFFQSKDQATIYTGIHSKDDPQDSPGILTDLLRNLYDFISHHYTNNRAWIYILLLLTLCLGGRKRLNGIVTSTVQLAISSCDILAEFHDVRLLHNVQNRRQRYLLDLLDYMGASRWRIIALAPHNERENAIASGNEQSCIEDQY